jgi:hypothetical protein
VFVTYDQNGRPTVDTKHARREYARALSTRLDMWVVASCGDEQPVLGRDRRWTLLVFNAQSLEHGRLDLATDLVGPDVMSWD